MTDAINIQRQEKKYRSKTECDQENYHTLSYICIQELPRILKVDHRDIGKNNAMISEDQHNQNGRQARGCC